jgi:hypothetical protein
MKDCKPGSGTGKTLNRAGLLFPGMVLACWVFSQGRISQGSEADDNPLEASPETPPAFQDPTDTKDADHLGKRDRDNLPILAKTYPLRVLRRSNSNQLYLLQKSTPGMPEVGRILLLKDEEAPLMAFRVVKVYENWPVIAAKKIRGYSSDFRHLPRGEIFSAVEKLADIDFDKTRVAAAQGDEPGGSNAAGLDADKDAASGTELAEMETAEKVLRDGLPDAAGGESVAKAAAPQRPPLPQTLPFDPVLDGGPTPGERPSEERKLSEDEVLGDKGALSALDGNDDVLNDAEARALAANPRLRSGAGLNTEEFGSDPADLALIAEEVHGFDIFRSSLSLGFGYFKNVGATGAAISPAGAQLRYGYNLGNMLLLKRAAYQDSLTLEGGIQLYKLTNYAVNNDAYTVLPFNLGLRYNIYFSSNTALFLYGGLTKSNVMEAANGSAEAVAILGGFIPSAGGGLLIRVGPHWEVRADIGIDMQALGLVLRF